LELRTAGGTVLERLGELPGGDELLATAAERGEGVELVGGAVRDILLDRHPRELDVVVSEDAHGFALALARRLGDLAADDPAEHCEVTYHERFGTALVGWQAGEIDVATRRTETYPAPGALPDVAPGTPEQDLQRRDFTVNAIAVALAGADRGAVRSLAGALEDLAAGSLRVLHDTSFQDDPTRILRLARYASRLHFDVDEHTAALVEQALAGGALRTVSGQRLGAELRLAFAEPDPLAPLVELDRLGVFGAWEHGVSFDERLVRTALEILPVDGSLEVLLAASLLLGLAQTLEREDTESAMRGFLSDLELPAGASEHAFRAAVSAHFVAERIDCTESTEAMLELVAPTPIESLALAGALRDLEDGPMSIGRGVVEEWLGRQRHISLQINGEDLIAAGVPEGPEIGRRLGVVYTLRVDNLIDDGREAELRAALAARI
jgi:tRNA nucleotidyltransferase (CCA-adding enzyme)